MDQHAFVHLAEAGGVPQLGAKVPIALNALCRQLDVPRLARHGGQGETQGVGAIGVHQFQRIHDVALGLGHLGALGVADQGVEEHPLERNLAGEVQAHHHHPGDPVEDDVEARHQGVGGIESGQVGGLHGPAQGRERPEAGREPGIEDVVILAQGLVVAIVLARLSLGALLRLLDEDLAVGTIPGRNAVTPPELAADAPGLDVAHPLEVGLFPVLRFEDGAAVFHRLDGRLGQGPGVDVPLVGQVGLDDGPRAVAVRNGVPGLFDAAQQAQRLEFLDHLLARGEAVQAAIGRRDILVQPRRGIEDVDHRQLVALADLKIVEVVRRGDLHGAGALLRVGVFVGDDRNRPPDDRQAHALADQGLVALVRRVDRDGGVAQHGFGPRGRHDDLARAIFQGVGKVPVVAVDLALLDLQIGDGGLELRIPVHQPLVAIDQLLLVQGDEHLADRCGQTLIQGEALATPVAGSAQAAQLVDDRAAGLGLPLPDLGHEGVTAHVPAADVALGGKLALDHHLGGDARVVGAGQPECGLAPHALEADQHVLQGVVQGVADVQRTGDVRRRDDHRERLGRRIVGGRKGAGRLPHLVEARLDGFGIEGFFKHGRSFRGVIYNPAPPRESRDRAFPERQLSTVKFAGPQPAWLGFRTSAVSVLDCARCARLPGPPSTGRWPAGSRPARP